MFQVSVYNDSGFVQILQDVTGQNTPAEYNPRHLDMMSYEVKGRILRINKTYETEGRLTICEVGIFGGKTVSFVMPF